MILKNRFVAKTLVLTAVLSLGGSGLALHAADKGKAKGKDKEAADAEGRVPLVLVTDAKGPDREGADRVSYSTVIKKAGPSVAAVIVARKAVPVPAISTPNLDELLQRGFPGLPGQGQRQLPRRQRQATPNPGAGEEAPAARANPASGVVVSADGYILTNQHVVEGADEVKVALGDPRKEYTAKVVGRDARSDVALLKIEATGLTPITLADSDKVELGDVVLALGNPGGRGLTVSRGIVSALAREGSGEGVDDFLQTDCAINAGNSGGPLLDASGRLVGLNAARGQNAAPDATPLVIPKASESGNEFTKLAKILEPSVVNITADFTQKPTESRRGPRARPQAP